MKTFHKTALRIFLFCVLIIVILTSISISPVKKASGQGRTVYYFPLFLNTKRIAQVSPSYYVTALNEVYLNNLGCELGQRDRGMPGAQDSVAVLAFGCPRCLKNGEFGANLFGMSPASLTDISIAVKQFASGYYRCTGSDFSSNLVIGVGTSNFPGGSAPCTTISSASAHGVAWSGMVRDINTWLKSEGIFHQVQVFGATDIELGWNSPEWSRAWVDGFNQVSENFLLHFGDAAGCPYEDNPGWSCGTSSFPNWTIEDVWYVSYGASPSLPLPLIYLTTGVHAKQWAYLSQYSVNTHGYRLNFTGVFTQWAACQQMGGCNFIDNKPDEAYQQLTTELEKNPSTAQYITWKTDISWILNTSLVNFENTTEDEHKSSPLKPLQFLAEDFETALGSNSLSPVLQSSVVDKLLTYQKLTEMAEISRQYPADKSTSLNLGLPNIRETTFEEGLIPNGEIPGHPYGVVINNVWQAQLYEGYIQVAAGSAPDDLQNGAIYIVTSPSDRTTFQSKTILAPVGCGLLEIMHAVDNVLYLESENGCRFVFDITEQDAQLIED